MPQKQDFRCPWCKARAVDNTCFDDERRHFICTNTECGRRYFEGEGPLPEVSTEELSEEAGAYELIEQITQRAAEINLAAAEEIATRAAEIALSRTKQPERRALLKRLFTR